MRTPMMWPVSLLIAALGAAWILLDPSGSAAFFKGVYDGVTAFGEALF